MAVNQLNGGRITGGAVIERELPSQFGNGNTINLQLNQDDFTMAQQIADTINRRGMGGATALDARTVQVRVPQGGSSQVRMLADIQNLEVGVAPQDAKIVIQLPYRFCCHEREVTLDNWRCGTGATSRSRSTSLANVSQPNTPFGGGQTVVTPQTQIDLRQSGGSLQSIRSSANLNSVVRALNALGATPIDLMSILQSMQSAGCLRAKLEII